MLPIHAFYQTCLAKKVLQMVTLWNIIIIIIVLYCTIHIIFSYIIAIRCSNVMCTGGFVSRLCVGDRSVWCIYNL